MSALDIFVLGNIVCMAGVIVTLAVIGRLI